MTRTIEAPPAHTLRKYGLLVTDWRALLNHQGGRCPMCERTFTKKRRPAVDHDHLTGLVRGLLCLPCNRSLGFLHEDVGWLERSAAYLRTPPAESLFDAPIRHRDAPPEAP